MDERPEFRRPEVWALALGKLDAVSNGMTIRIKVYRTRDEVFFLFDFVIRSHGVVAW
ncbi:hypothetical protein IWQ49_003750 [Labrenzia sp. EL_126]|nr:hypothetical protein [Labrenzia sp. EL_126]